MKQTHKIVILSLWGLAGLLLAAWGAMFLATRSARSAAEARTHMVHMSGAEGAGMVSAEYEVPPIPVPQFAFTDQNGETFSTANMKGKVWIADFIFTRCTGPCPMMTAHMRRLQQMFKGTPVHFVSFSVDPEYDTPAVLKKYASQYEADLSNWSFLTGPVNDLFSVARTLLIGITPGSGEMAITHSVKFILIDSQGITRGFYTGTDTQQLEDLVRDARRLAGT